MSDAEVVEGRAMSRLLDRLLGRRNEPAATALPAAVAAVTQAPTTAPAPPTRRKRAPSLGRAPLGSRLPAGLTRPDRMPLLLLGLVVAGGTFLRVWRLDALGYNSDEAVYAGQAASIANDPAYTPYFPIFRAHPLLFQSMLSIAYHFHPDDVVGRLYAAAFGVATIVLVYKLGELLYGRKVGLVAALIIALMPYEVVVSRQVLLDGPMTFFATLTLYALARYAKGRAPIWLYGAAGAMGLTILTKETSILLLGAAYAFIAMSPELGVRLRHIVLSLVVLVLVFLPYPLALMFSGRTATGHAYLTWQLFRRPNHSWLFYPSVVPEAIGYLVVLMAVIGLVAFRRHAGWRERLLLCWIVVPTLFFSLWPVKGFQYLLPIAPPIAVLAGRALVRLPELLPGLGRRAAPVVAGLVAVSLVVPTWGRVEPSPGATFLAGSGGVPGGREAGHWIAANIPKGSVLLALGPSMANIIQFYGHRQAYGLSVSPNPLHRNPAYQAVANPDLMIRHNEIQYLVWDSYSAARSQFFATHLLRYVDRYNGRPIHTELVRVRSKDGEMSAVPVIVIFAVRSSNAVTR